MTDMTVTNPNEVLSYNAGNYQRYIMCAGNYN